jgi:hypothetical protein
LFIFLVVGITDVEPLAKFNAADKIRANANKLAKQNSRISQKQQVAPLTKAVQPPRFSKRGGSSIRKSNSKVSGFANPTSLDATPIQMFVRRADSGPWTCFQEIYVDGRLNHLVQDIIESGGLQAEILRVSLQDKLSSVLFGVDFRLLVSDEDDENCDDTSDGDGNGNGDDLDIVADGSGTSKTSIMGSSSLDTRERLDAAFVAASEARKKLVLLAKESVPAFRKVHARDIQFGYRILAEGEPIHHLPSHIELLSNDDEMHVTGNIHGALYGRADSIDPIDMDVILGRAQGRGGLPHAYEELKSTILHAVESLVVKNKKANHNASTRMLDPNSKMDIRGGKILLDSYGDGRGDHDGDGSPSFDLYVCSDGSAHLHQKQCIRASGGVYVALLRGQSSSLLDGESEILLDSMALHLSGAAGVVSSSFDAELAASLGSIVLARLIVDAFEKGNDDVSGGRITFLTDSKTLVRSLRNGPSTNSQFTERSTPSRLASWNFIMDQIEYLSEKGHAVKVQWIPGHPESRHRSTKDWSFLDGAIWAADSVASGGADEMPSQVAQKKKADQLHILSAEADTWWKVMGIDAEAGGGGVLKVDLKDFICTCCGMML